MLDLTADRTDRLDAEPRSSDPVVAPGVPGVGGLLELPMLLAGVESGITFVYEALERVAGHFGLRDAMVVVDNPSVGRQAFRLGRRPAAAPRLSALPPVAVAPAGLYADPPVVDEHTARYVSSLIEVAVRLDVARHDATRDALTGLLNRRSYEDALAQATARSSRYGWPFSLVLLDLDHFKTINDTWGHAAGDEALRSFGADIRSCLRRGDVAARVGGDEFALLVLAANERHAVAALVERLRATTARSPFESGLRFSAGIAVYPDDATDPVTLSRIADDRLYADKTAGA